MKNQNTKVTAMISFIKKAQSKLTALLLTLVMSVLMSASYAIEEEITYFHNDALGSPVAATDEAGNIKWREEYLPYGERLLKQEGGTNDTWFTGKQEDKATGLSYFGARWYDPVLGHFMEIDPVGFQEDNIHSFNRYSYANNNPYAFVDPDGREPILPSAMWSVLGKEAPPAWNAIKQGTVGGLTVISVVATSGIGAAPRLTAAGLSSMTAKEIGILRSAAAGKGNFGLGTATKAQADKLGKAWVGDGAKLASDGKTLVSKDLLKQYRPPSFKGKLGKTQANFERRFAGQQSKKWQSNGHLDIKK